LQLTADCWTGGYFFKFIVLFTFRHWRDIIWMKIESLTPSWADSKKWVYCRVEFCLSYLTRIKNKFWTFWILKRMNTFPGRRIPSTWKGMHLLGWIKNSSWFFKLPLMLNIYV
jgi:hypothetical protein